ncbi:hypothetical protein [Oceaniglobus ichthyenteri]|uniref:hypothetical protein n=1 Tax=Oceaniglobus ichthyenteri TaxID=2136177 RepID=UPI000D3B18CA|nr:hypothetical protein [Oceaniglobus ichthyenteri]
MTDRPTDPLETLFAQARQAPPDLPDDLFARILADAETVDQARHKTVAKSGWWRELGTMLGGWPSVAGLATAAVAGVWIGVAQPVGLNDFTLIDDSETATEFDLVDLMPGFDILAAEG